MDFLRIAGKTSLDLQRTLIMGDGVRVVTSDLNSCMNSIDCFGRALAVDTAYRHLTSAEQYLMDSQKMQDSAPHTNVADKALDYIDRAKEFLRPYAVSEDNASCREPPVCVVKDAKTASAGPMEVMVEVAMRKNSSIKNPSQFI
jgi:hypothetical protein